MTTEELAQLGVDMIWLGLDDDTVATVIGLAVFGNEILLALSKSDLVSVADSIMGTLEAASRTA